MTEPTLSDRGFKRYDAIPSTYGGGVRLVESSVATAPHVWLFAEAPVNLNEPDGEMVEASLHLTLENATLLHEQLGHLIEHHYQVEER